MTMRPSLIIAGAGILALSGCALAVQERGEKNEVSERRLALSQVPQGALAGATEVLAFVSGAELVRLRDGRTVYELKGKSHTGETLEVYVSGGGLIIGTEGEDDDRMAGRFSRARQRPVIRPAVEKGQES